MQMLASFFQFSGDRMLIGGCLSDGWESSSNVAMRLVFLRWTFSGLSSADAFFLSVLDF